MKCLTYTGHIMLMPGRFFLGPLVSFCALVFMVWKILWILSVFVTPCPSLCGPNLEPPRRLFARRGTKRVSSCHGLLLLSDTCQTVLMPNRDCRVSIYRAGRRVVPRLRESCPLTPSGRRGRGQVNATQGPLFRPALYRG